MRAVSDMLVCVQIVTDQHLGFHLLRYLAYHFQHFLGILTDDNLYSQPVAIPVVLLMATPSASNRSSTPP